MKGEIPAFFPVSCHTDRVGPGTIFVAIKGMKEDGVHYLQKALERGSRMLVVQEGVLIPAPVLETIKLYQAELVRVPSARSALASLSAQMAGYPARSLKIIGVTGTKGKTTTTFLIEQMLKTAGYRTALLSTAGHRIREKVFDAALTTEQPDYMHVFFSLCVQEGVEWVVVEVAAQAVTLSRIEGIQFDLIVFTNFSQEHGEFYENTDDYFKAKQLVCSQLKPQGVLLLNGDDPKVASLKELFPAAYLFSVQSTCTLPVLVGQLKRSDRQGLEFVLQAQGASCVGRAPQLLGLFNMYNSTAAAAAAMLLGVPLATIGQALALFPGVPGRLNTYKLPQGALVIIDYAHNPSSYEAFLSSMRPLTSHLIVVFGASGEREPGRRPLMGAIASTYADCVIITSDNPRSEDPQNIADQVVAGISAEHQHKVHVELDREKAIRLACQSAHSDTIITLLGKGTQEYQIIKGVKMPFSEAAIIRELGGYKQSSYLVA